MGAILIARQKGSYFGQIRVFLIYAYAAFSLVLGVEYIRSFIPTETGGVWYTLLGTSAVLAGNIALTLASASYFERRPGQKFNSPIILYTGYAAFLLAALWVLRPFQIEFIQRPYGDLVPSPDFDVWYSLGLIGLEIAFILYPVRLMIKRSRRVGSIPASKALIFLPLIWSGFGAVLLLFYGLFRSAGLEIAEVGDLISALLFSLTGYFFRKTSLVEGFFEGPLVIGPQRRDYPSLFSSRLGVARSQLLGRKILFEFDPSSGYEIMVRDFVQESLTTAKFALVITHKGSPVYLALSAEPRVRLLCLTSSVSYPKQGSSENEMLLPQDDPSIILGAISKALNSNPKDELCVLIDQISELIAIIGMEKTHAFLGYSLELLSKPTISAMYVLNTSAHDPKVVAAVRALFAHQIERRAGGLRIVKTL